MFPQAAGYSHAIVFGGVIELYSDLTANRKLPRIQADLARIYSLLSERGVRVIGITVAPWGGFSKYFTAARSQATRSLNHWILSQKPAGQLSAVVDAYPLLSCGDEPEKLCPELARPFKDGLHFGTLGHQRLADALQAAAFPSCQISGG